MYLFLFELMPRVNNSRQGSISSGAHNLRPGLDLCLLVLCQHLDPLNSSFIISDPEGTDGESPRTITDHTEARVGSLQNPARRTDCVRTSNRPSYVQTRYACAWADSKEVALSVLKMPPSACLADHMSQVSSYSGSVV